MCEAADTSACSELSQDDLDAATDQEADDLLGNGILIETNSGVVCMSLNEAISTSNINLSPEQLRKVAARLIVQQNIHKSKERTVPSLRTICDSDGGFSSECSDTTTASTSSIYPSLLGHGLLGVLGRPGRDKSSEESDSTRSIHQPSSDGCLSPHPVSIKKKGRGGWPKGRKRKPELLNLPPKAPATGYNLYLNEQRSFFKDSSLQFYEITKIIGNRWSSLTLEEKKPYLDRAEEDKKRYREELKVYRQSEAYRAYLNKKRRKRLQNNVMSESDMDATDDFDEEDNEELYCRTCDQWFHNLHNKREHLLAKKHCTSLAGEIRRELSNSERTLTEQTIVKADLTLDESSLEASSLSRSGVESDAVSGITGNSIGEAMRHLVSLVKSRDLEYKSLQVRHQQTVETHKALRLRLNQLCEKEAQLQKHLVQQKELEKELEDKVYQLWQVPSLFVMAQYEDTTDFSEGTS